jgi:acylphosphatase
MGLVARRWLVRGRVQGVGFRYFVQARASELGLAGFTRNLDDGAVEVYAVGPEPLLQDLAGLLHKGPPASDVRSVEEFEAAPQALKGFRIERG